MTNIKIVGSRSEVRFKLLKLMIIENDIRAAELGNASKANIDLDPIRMKDIEDIMTK